MRPLKIQLQKTMLLGDCWRSGAEVLAMQTATQIGKRKSEILTKFRKSDFPATHGWIASLNELDLYFGVKTPKKYGMIWRRPLKGIVQQKVVTNY